MKILVKQSALLPRREPLATLNMIFSVTNGDWSLLLFQLGICSFNSRLLVPRALALFLSGLTICYSIWEYSVGISNCLAHSSCKPRYSVTNTKC